MIIGNHVLWDNICDKTQSCIKQFNLLPSKDVIVGLSGGKDSSLLTFILRDLGYNVLPVVIDMGYTNFDLNKIQTNFKAMSISIEIINAMEYCYKLPDNKRFYIKSLINFLHKEESKIPCTNCSIVKRTVLSYFASSIGINDIAFGHHKDDIITTMLKDYYVFLYYKKYVKYNTEKFKIFVNENDPDINIIEKLIIDKLVGTMSISINDEINNTRIIRPFALVSETDIKKSIIDIGFQPLSSNCSHRYFQNKNQQPVTKREIVHSKTLELCDNENLNYILIKLAISCLNIYGISLYNPRSIRQKLYPGFEE